MRSQAIRERMFKMLRGHIDKDRYKELWEDINLLSPAASAFPWPDTRAVITYMMLLDVMVKLDKLEEELRLTN